MLEARLVFIDLLSITIAHNRQAVIYQAVSNGVQIMKKDFKQLPKKNVSSQGMSIVELMVVLIIIGVLAAVAIPQLLATRRLTKFSGIQQQLLASLRDARQLAMSQKRQITIQYDDANKLVRTFEVPVPTPSVAPPVPTPPVIAVFGNNGDARNRVVKLTDGGLLASDLRYGAPAGANIALDDTVDQTALANGKINITFSPRGDVIEIIDDVGIPTNKALFFYENNTKAAFAISILGPGGRIKLWRYDGNEYQSSY